MFQTQPEFQALLENNFLYSFIFRGILVIGYYLESDLQAYCAGQKMQHFPDEFLVYIQYPLSFLLSESKEDNTSDLVIALRPFFKIDPSEAFFASQKTDLHDIFFMSLFFNNFSSSKFI
jgi:hypothetical protein